MALDRGTGPRAASALRTVRIQKRTRMVQPAKRWVRSKMSCRFVRKDGCAVARMATKMARIR